MALTYAMYQHLILRHIINIKSIRFVLDVNSNPTTSDETLLSFNV
jgi:hypothetical protein